MASVVNDPNGFKRVIFKGLDRKRHPIRLGECSEKFAITVGGHIEEIVNATIRSLPVARTTAEWLATLSPIMEAKLVKVGLIHPRDDANPITLGRFLDAYIERRSDVKPNTKQFFGHVRTNLIDVFGADRPLDSLTAGDADDFRRALQRLGEPSDPKPEAKTRKQLKLGPVTIARRCSMARTFFRDAVKRKLIDSNPFEDIGSGPKSNPARQQFIDQPTIEKVIAGCPDAEWRLLVALSRYGGLRIPSEACLLRWRDVDWNEGRLTIHSPKTEHHAGKSSRAVPIFGELRPYLDELFNTVTNGFEQPVNPDAWVLAGLHRQAATVGDWKRVNLRTRFEKIIKRAGVTPWPRLWHNLRASRQTELTEVFPAHVVSAWLGNSERIAAQHYLQVLDSHFEKAARVPARATPASDDFETHRATEKAKPSHFRGSAFERHAQRDSNPRPTD